jgi:hypothetical protein
MMSETTFDAAVGVGVVAVVAAALAFRKEGNAKPALAECIAAEAKLDTVLGES